MLHSRSRNTLWKCFSICIYKATTKIPSTSHTNIKHHSLTVEYAYSSRPFSDELKMIFIKLWSEALTKSSVEVSSTGWGMMCSSFWILSTAISRSYILILASANYKLSRRWHASCMQQQWIMSGISHVQSTQLLIIFYCCRTAGKMYKHCDFF